MHVFDATFNTAGNETLTATDTTATDPVLRATSNPITTRGLEVTSFTWNLSGFTATFSKAA